MVIMVQKRVSLTDDQAQWINDNHVDLTRLVQDELDKRITSNSPHNTLQTTVKNVRVFFMVSMLGFATFMFALLAPPVAGADPTMAAVLAVMGGVVAAYGTIQTIRWGG